MWAAGAVAFEMLFGLSPFSIGAQSEADIERAILDPGPVFIPEMTKALTRVSSEAVEFLRVRSCCLLVWRGSVWSGCPRVLCNVTT